MGVGTRQHAEQIKPGNVIASADRGEAVPQGAMLLQVRIGVRLFRRGMPHSTE